MNILNTQVVLDLDLLCSNIKAYDKSLTQVVHFKSAHLKFCLFQDSLKRS